MKINKFDLIKTVNSILLIIAGTLILAFGTAIFILPFDMVVGGVSGLAILVDAVLPFEFLSIDFIITILTWILFFIGLIVLGRDFAMKTLISSIVYPIGISLFLRLPDPNVLGGVFYLQETTHPELALIISAIVGGALVGTGCAVTFLGGGSTGGVDIIAFTICKIFKRIKSSVVIFAVDASIILFGIFVFKDLLLSLLGVISAMITAFVIDKVFLDGSRALVAQIVTDRYDEITQEVIEKLDRSSTIFDVTGGYTKQGKKMVMVSFTMSQYAEMMHIIKRWDRGAFVTVYKAHEINGEGWTK